MPLLDVEGGTRPATQRKRPFRLVTKLPLVGNLRRTGYSLAAGLVVALAPAPALARADEPSPPDPSVMDIVDSVLAQNPQPPENPAPPARPTPPQPPGT
jgi:hypothetical protein